ncbi:hypothetical protein BH09ACT4_BH09ACT4_10740 [soil metagenome]
MTDPVSGADPTRVSIAPGVSMLAVLGSLNYKAWYALAEYVDNALQSFLSAPEEMERIGVLAVAIDYQSTTGVITIEDNALGIPLVDFPRAFKPAELPVDRSGLSEFGMGMKSASCWFAKRWSVTTSVRGEAVSRTVEFDIETIVRDNVDTLEIRELPEDIDDHYTRIRLWDLQSPIATRTLGKIKDHLADIYRVFLRNGLMSISFRGESLVFEEPGILEATQFDFPGSEPVRWEKEIDFDFGEGQTVRGFAALLATGQQSRAGFSLFRRGRVIEGSGDELYKPSQIYGAGNTYRSQRLFGELHLDGFEVSHTKDGFQWHESEVSFLELLKQHLDSDPVPLLRQAEGFRARASRKEQEAMVAGAIDRTVELLDRELEQELEALDASPEPHQDAAPPADAPVYAREFKTEYRAIKWHVFVEARAQSEADSWLTFADTKSGPSSREMHISLNLSHPFLIRFAQKDPDALEATLRIAVALAISDAVGRIADLQAAAVFRNVSELLNGVLSDP